MRISETYGAQASKENSPTSGLLRFLVARGGIDQGRGCLTLALDYFTYSPIHRLEFSFAPQGIA